MWMLKMCFRLVEDEGCPLNVDNIGCLIKCNAGPRLSVIFLSHRGNNSKTFFFLLGIKD